MNPTKRASSITGLRKGIGQAPARAAENPNHGSDLPPAPKTKPARVTLNLPPELYRQLARWADSAAETIGVPRVGVQDAMRCMIKVISGDEAPSCSARVMAELRGELGG